MITFTLCLLALVAGYFLSLIHIYHHVHRLQQILREIALFEEKGVEAVVHIVLKIVQRAYFGQDRCV